MLKLVLLKLFSVSVWLTLPLSLAAAEAPDAALIGCWRAELVQQTYEDGRVWNDIGGCTLEFSADRIESACALRLGNRSVVYRYGISEPGRYIARIVEHPSMPAAVGSERSYDYRIDGDRLYITTDPQAAQPSPLNAVIRVMSVSVRVGSQTDRDDVNDREKAGCQGRLTRLEVAPLLAFSIS